MYLTKHGRPKSNSFKKKIFYLSFCLDKNCNFIRKTLYSALRKNNNIFNI